jgi:hypothetical protein
MKESLDNAKEELKRVDHLIYVSLKYTRTVDVLLSIVERMINAYTNIVDALIKYAVKSKKIKDAPGTDFLKAEEVKKIFDDPAMKDNIDFYLMLRKLKTAEHLKSSEYRRHVTMTAVVEGKEIKIDIDNITEYYKRLQEFVKYVEEMVEKK